MKNSIIFLACVLAAMFLPKQVNGQVEMPKTVFGNCFSSTVTDSIPTKEDTDTSDLWLKGLMPNAVLRVDTEIGKQTKDTIIVSVLCPMSTSPAEKEDGTSVKIGLDVFIMPMRQERTWEVQTVETFGRNQSDIIWSAWEIRPVQIASRWLDPIDGCFQLIPLGKSN